MTAAVDTRSPREAVRDSYLRPSNERVFAFRLGVDPKTNDELADDLDRRAKALRLTATRPVEAREDYEAVCRRVETTMYGSRSDWDRGRLARRIWTTGECVFHAYWVLFGSNDGSGCDCASCRKIVAG